MKVWKRIRPCEVIPAQRIKFDAKYHLGVREIIPLLYTLLNPSRIGLDKFFFNVMLKVEKVIRLANGYFNPTPA